MTAGQRFVVQQHAARRTHYDFRLEFEGVLKSWAVPKGPSPNPADKRLAVHVEDHPVDYVNFEGVIPPDNYGAGAVIVWDRGRWVALNDIAAGFDKGKLLFELRGHKLRGKWTLVKTKRGKNEWLLIKERDAYATDKSTEDYPADSVLSGRTVEQVAGGDPRGAAVAARLRKLGAARRELRARDLKPMLAMPGKPFSDPRWVFELKYDGYRLFAEGRAGEVKLYSRAGLDFTTTFPEIAEIVAALPFEQFILDTEVVVLDERGLPSFALLQKRGRLTRRADVARAALELPASLYAFDLLAFEGFDLRALPLVERKAALRTLLPVSGAVRYSEHFLRQGEAMFDEAERLGLEGIVGKRAASPYVSKRSPDWIKINAAKSDDFVVVGYLPPKQGGKGFGALLLAQYRGGVLTYAGRAGSGFAARDFAVLEPMLAAKPRAEPPAAAEEPRGAVWLADGPVVQVKFKHRTPDGNLRQPVFLRLRDDKKPAECVWHDDAADCVGGGASRSLRSPSRRSGRPSHSRISTRCSGRPTASRRATSSPITKASPSGCCRISQDRPVVLTRYPDGIDGKSFFQKDAPVYAPSWLRLETMWSEHAEREIRYFVLDDVESLLYVANMGTIPLHVWSSRVAALERPDWCILDLDPKGAPLKHVIEIARHIHALCEDVGLTQLRQDQRLDGLARADPARCALHLRAIAHARRAPGAFHGEVPAGDRDDRALRVRSRRQGLSRLSAERPRPIARVAVLRAAVARRARLDAARVVADQWPAQARALQHSLGSQVAANAWRPARCRAHGVDGHAGRARGAHAPARGVSGRRATC